MLKILYHHALSSFSWLINFLTLVVIIQIFYPNVELVISVWIAGKAESKSRSWNASSNFRKGNKEVFNVI